MDAARAGAGDEHFPAGLYLDAGVDDIAGEEAGGGVDRIDDQKALRPPRLADVHGGADVLPDERGTAGGIRAADEMVPALHTKSSSRLSQASSSSRLASFKR